MKSLMVEVEFISSTVAGMETSYTLMLFWDGRRGFLSGVEWEDFHYIWGGGKGLLLYRSTGFNCVV